MSRAYELYKVAEELSGAIKNASLDSGIKKEAEKSEVNELREEIDDLKNRIENMSGTSESNNSAVEKLAGSNVSQVNDEDVELDDFTLGEPSGHSKTSSSVVNPLSDYLHKKYK